MSGALQAVFQNQRSFRAPPGQQAFTTAGTFTWIAPTGVTSVSVLCIGPGAGGEGGRGGMSGGGGGALAYQNGISVTPGNSYNLRTGATDAGVNKFSEFSTHVKALGGGGTDQGWGRPAGVVITGTGYSGGVGGFGDIDASFGGGGAGAGGYSGAGGAGGASPDAEGSTGSGGSGGGGAGYGHGGGVGILGQGSSGAGGVGRGANGGVGSGGTGRVHGAGGNGNGGAGGVGAVRIIWPGATRSFPSTNTGDL